MIAAEPAVVEERDGQTPNESLVKRNLIDVTQMIIQIVRIVGDDLTTTVEAGEALTEMEEELNEAMSVLNGLE